MEDNGEVFVAAVMLDVIYQLVMLHKICLGEASVVAILLAILRYLLLRAPVARWPAGRKVGHERRTDAQTIHAPVGYFHATRLRTHLSRP
jgi:hypothetical protein